MVYCLDSVHRTLLLSLKLEKYAKRLDSVGEGLLILFMTMGIIN